MTSSTNDQDKPAAPSNKADNHALSRRNILLGSSALVRLATMANILESEMDGIKRRGVVQEKPSTAFAAG